MSRPAFGHAMLERWALDPSILYLNHGTVGAPPRRVLEAQQKIRDEIATEEGDESETRRRAAG